MNNTIEAVAFDKDGVIFDSEKVYAKALDITANAAGILLPPDFHQRLLGVSEEKTLAVLQEIMGTQAHDFLYRRWIPQVRFLLEHEGLDFIPGAESLIETLHAQGYPLALVTSDSQENLLRDVNATRPDLLKYFSVIITRDDVNEPKPAAEPYQRAAALLGVAPQQLLVVEDSDIGATAAVLAGAQVLLLAADGRKVADVIAAKVRRVIGSHHDVVRELSA